MKSDALKKNAFWILAGVAPFLTFLTFLFDVLVIFIMRFGLLITVMGELFRRHDVGGFTDAEYAAVRAGIVG